MKNIKIYMMIVLLGVLSSYSNEVFGQQDFVIIVNKSVKQQTIDQSDLRRIYFGFTTQWKNFEKIKPAYAQQSSDSFWVQLKTTETKFKSFWTKRVFSGNGVTPINSEGERVLEYVANNPGAIGIIPASLKGDIGSSCKLLALK